MMMILVVLLLVLNHANNNENNEDSKSHESQGIDDPKRGGKTSNKTRKKLDAESIDATIKDD